MKPNLRTLFLLLLIGSAALPVSASELTGTPFPRLSFGVAGVAHILNNADLREYFVENDYGLVPGYQLDAEFRLLHTDKAAAYLVLNLNQIENNTGIEVTTVEQPAGTGYNIYQSFQYRNIGARIAVRVDEKSRMWVEGGGSFVRYTLKHEGDSSIFTPVQVHGWFAGVGGAAEIISPHLALFFRLTYTSTPMYSNGYFPGDGNYPYRTEYGGYSAALGLRFEI